jgi:chromosome partitioning protein
MMAKRYNGIREQRHCFTTFWRHDTGLIMYTLAFLSQKGGSGKTTLAVHTAVAAQEDGERVVIVDTDLQRSATSWGTARKRADEHAVPEVAPIAAAELDDVIAASRDDAMTLCIIDTAPHAAPDATRVAKKADLVVIPCRPSAFDLAAVDSAVSIVKAAGAPAVLVLSACPFRAIEIAETRAELETKGFPVAPVIITDRRAFARAVATGRAVTEFEGEGRAAEEIRALWHWFKEQMYGKSKNKDHRVSRVHEPRKRARRA